MEWETETPGTEETKTGAAPEEGTAPEIPAGTETVPETSGAEEPAETETGSGAETVAAPETETAPEIPAEPETVPETSGAEGYGYITTAYDSGTVTEALDIQTEVIREQTAAMEAGFAGVCVLLGFLIGVVFIQGIRLRRV